MFDLNRRYNRRDNRPIIAPFVAPIHIKPVPSSLSHQWAIYPKYDRRGCESPSGYEAYGPCISYKGVKGTFCLATVNR